MNGARPKAPALTIIANAATWATSVVQLTPAGRRLLERLAFLAPEAVSESLFDVATPGDDADFDAREALADLFAYSLAAPGKAADGGTQEPSFAVHRLVQEFTQRGLKEAKQRQILEEGLGWLKAAFVGEPQDVRSWATLDPLAPHALALARRADEAGIPEPTARLMNTLGMLFFVKSKYAEAEPTSKDCGGSWIFRARAASGATCRKTCHRKAMFSGVKDWI